MTLSEIFEGLTAIGLFISVALVFTELRRNGKATRLNNSMLFTERHFNLRNLTLSQDLADVIVRGRQGLEHLSKTEQLIFTNYLLNTAQTASILILNGEGKRVTPEIAEKQALRIVRDEWDNKGGREYWNLIKNDPPVVPHVKVQLAQAMAS